MLLTGHEQERIDGATRWRRAYGGAQIVVSFF